MTARINGTVLTEIQSGLEKGVNDARRGANALLAGTGQPALYGPAALSVTVTVNGQAPVPAAPQPVFGGSATTFKPAPAQQPVAPAPKPTSGHTPS